MGKKIMYILDAPMALSDLITHLRSTGNILAGDEYIKASEEVEMGEILIEIADVLEKHGLK